MDDAARDRTQDWLLPERSKPPLLGELVERIDEALATARSSEAAAVSIGAVALDAADQARRAVDLAERANAALLSAQASAAAAAGPRNGATPGGPAVQMTDGPSNVPMGPPAAVPPQSATVASPQPPVADEDVFRRFSAHADRIAARLQALERVPVYA